ncbi:hypothetical protein Y032_0003g1396 [Ancylostoma ceylanicum]|uniref:Uncharacterized protein n=1 Tax=Ancylostoma ceylanicum TaxID=53326 RepID=A0A016VWZ9_9BILA|nr:hypothetical protein Y032_0003g1396 [Ancylostoma ceylanicum]
MSLANMFDGIHTSLPLRSGEQLYYREKQEIHKKKSTMAYAGGSVQMLADTEHHAPSGDWFHVVLIALTITICFNITVLSYRYFAIIRREKLDRLNKSKEMVTETWYLEKEVIKKEAENRRKKREAAKKELL